MRVPWHFGAIVLLCVVSCSETPEVGGLPQALPFTVQRDPAGTPLGPAEVAAFTAELTAFWKRSDFFNWAARVSHGVDASTGQPHFSVWWHDVEAEKRDGVVTFRHGSTGGGHNVYIPTSRVLSQAAAGFLLTGDPAMERLVERYARGIMAACAGLVHDASDPNRYLMARNVVTQNHTYTIDGRAAAVDFTPWYSAYSSWNAQRFRYASNPSWGDVWVTNMRSKDDVPHIFVADAWLRYVIEADAGGPAVKEAARLADECVRGFAKDIVDSGYLIRTKDESGQVFVPTEDLASFVQYESIIPNGECTGKLSSALIAYGDRRDNDCERGDGNDYEAIATATHYYNYAIVRTFHLSSALHALIAGENAAAERLVRGLVFRAQRYGDPASDEPGFDEQRWKPELAAFLMESSAAGLPLTSDEVRAIHEQYRMAIEAYSAWPRWDLWDPSVPDGVYSSNDGYLPSDRGTLVSIEDIGLALEYCASPFRNPEGAALVDCELVKDPSRW